MPLPASHSPSTPHQKLAWSPKGGQLFGVEGRLLSYGEHLRGVEILINLIQPAGHHQKLEEEGLRPT